MPKKKGRSGRGLSRSRFLRLSIGRLSNSGLKEDDGRMIMESELNPTNLSIEIHNGPCSSSRSSSPTLASPPTARLQISHHALERSLMRGIPLRNVQSVVSPQTVPTPSNHGIDGRLKYQSKGLTVVTDQSSSRVLTSYQTSRAYPPRKRIENNVIRRFQRYDGPDKIEYYHKLAAKMRALIKRRGRMEKLKIPQKMRNPTSNKARGRRPSKRSKLIYPYREALKSPRDVHLVKVPEKSWKEAKEGRKKESQKGQKGGKSKQYEKKEKVEVHSPKIPKASKRAIVGSNKLFETVPVPAASTASNVSRKAMAARQELSVIIKSIVGAPNPTKVTPKPTSTAPSKPVRVPTRIPEVVLQPLKSSAAIAEVARPLPTPKPKSPPKKKKNSPSRKNREPNAPNFQSQYSALDPRAQTLPSPSLYVVPSPPNIYQQRPPIDPHCWQLPVDYYNPASHMTSVPPQFLYYPYYHYPWQALGPILLLPPHLLSQKQVAEPIPQSQRPY